MTMKINREAYKSLIDDDIEFLSSLPDTMEKRHIEAVLLGSINHYYPDRNRVEMEEKPDRDYNDDNTF